MKTDILHNSADKLKSQAFKVPEAYFTEVKAAIKEEVTASKKVSSWQAYRPHISVAAALAIMLTAGTFLLEKNNSPEDMSYEDYLVHSDMLISAEYDQEETQLADAPVANEDIIEYLIYTGVTAEVIELSK